jgi:hypothetical protein
MGLVYGQDVILSTPNDDTHTDMAIGCARSCTFEMTRDTIETSTTGSGQFRTYVGGPMAFSGTIEGLTFIQDTLGTTFDLGRMYEAIQNNNPFVIKYYETDVDNTYFLQKECTVIIAVSYTHLRAHETG